MLSNTQAFIFDLKEKTFREITMGEKFKAFRDLPDSPALQGTKTSNAICFADGKGVNSAVDLVTGTYTDTPPSDCPKLYAQKSIEEMYKDLKLPDGYELIGTSTQFGTIRAAPTP